MIEHPIVGAWRLLAWEIHYPDKVVEPFGAAPEGRILYSANGQMLAAIARKDRPVLSEPIPARAPDAEKLVAFDSYFSYGGHFDIEGELVHHHVALALNPNFVGSRQTRRMTFNGDELTLSAQEGPRFHSLRWQRCRT